MTSPLTYLVPLSLLAIAALAADEPVREASPIPTLAAPVPDDPDSAETCAKCHTEIYEEWKGRAHHQAWDNELYQAAIKEKRRPKVCHACHIPGPVLGRLGKKPAARKDAKSHGEGVTCVACHKHQDKIHGPFGAATDAHDSAKHPAFSESGADDLCYGCHALKIGPVLPLAKDFRSADVAGKTGKHCITCHMPEVERHHAVSMVTGKPTGEKRKGRRHTVLGPSDKEFAAKAFAFTCRKDGTDLVLAIENKAGHRIPGLTLRTFPIVVELTGPDGDSLAKHDLEISSENPLGVLETREVRYPLVDGLAKVKIRVDHKLDGKKVDTIIDETLDL